MTPFTKLKWSALLLVINAATSMMFAPILGAQTEHVSPWRYQGGHPPGDFLSNEGAEKMARELRQIKISGCRESDLSIMGLIGVINKNLEMARRKERVYLTQGPKSDVRIADHFSQSKSLDQDPFSFFVKKPEGTLNSKALTAEINQGSVYDLLENLRAWWGSTVGCYSSGIYINAGRNWPYLLEKAQFYPLEFK